MALGQRPWLAVKGAHRPAPQARCTPLPALLPSRLPQASPRPERPHVPHACCQSSDRRHRPEEAHRGRGPPRRHQQGLGAREVDPARAPFDAALVVGAAPSRGRARGAFCAARERSFVEVHAGRAEEASGEERDHAQAQRALSAHRGDGPLGGHEQPGDPRARTERDRGLVAGDVRREQGAPGREDPCSIPRSSPRSTIPSREAERSRSRRSVLASRRTRAI